VTAVAIVSCVRKLLVVLALTSAVVPLSFAGAGASGDQPLRVMTYNIRLGVAEDGPNHWARRRHMLIRLLKREMADVIGLQEAHDFQIDQILKALPTYAVVGVGREDGRNKGEFSAILFRKDQFNVAEAGTFWLSDTPAVPNSVSWGNHVTRISTWGRFVRKNGGSFYLYNLHLDHESQSSRERSIEMIRTRIKERIFINDPVIVTGDFNVGESNNVLELLKTIDERTTLQDSFRVIHPHENVVGTFNGFEFGSNFGEKIDYIFVPTGTQVLSAQILRFSLNYRYPSDHFAVTATVRLP
jgi:endonuclease/exonuclease/phosphatase family metal-dependent hydrolase